MPVVPIHHLILIVDGIALLCGVVNYVLQKQDCPKVLLSTHFAEAIEFLHESPHPNLEFLTMDYMVLITLKNYLWAHFILLDARKLI